MEGQRTVGSPGENLVATEVETEMVKVGAEEVDSQGEEEDSMEIGDRRSAVTEVEEGITETGVNVVDRLEEENVVARTKEEENAEVDIRFSPQLSQGKPSHSIFLSHLSLATQSSDLSHHSRRTLLSLCKSLLCSVY
jgi:hypothetical protein